MPQGPQGPCRDPEPGSCACSWNSPLQCDSQDRIILRYPAEKVKTKLAAFTAASERWPSDGLPRHPVAWLVSTGRFKAIDALRRRARFDASLAAIAAGFDTVTEHPTLVEDEMLEDDRLRLTFTCCHPALTPDARIALTLCEACGLTTEEIARAFLSGAPTLAQHIVRVKAKIRDARTPYHVPAGAELADRLDAALHVIYLVFNEGYSASAGASVTRYNLSAERHFLDARLRARIAGE